MDDHNPYLKPWQAPRASARGGEDRIERYGPELANIPWQTRAAPPSAYENALADALEKAFGDGIVELAPLVARLNAEGVRAPDGTAWTEESFTAELARLGA